ncbi:unnamed protein product [Cunninghamella blakesleeana]
MSNKKIKYITINKKHYNQLIKTISLLHKNNKLLGEENLSFKNINGELKYKLDNLNNILYKNTLKNKSKDCNTNECNNTKNWKYDEVYCLNHFKNLENQNNENIKKIENNSNELENMEDDELQVEYNEEETYDNKADNESIYSNHSDTCKNKSRNKYNKLDANKIELELISSINNLIISIENIIN